jgi:hypothetical protein
MNSTLPRGSIPIGTLRQSPLAPTRIDSRQPSRKNQDQPPAPQVGHRVGQYRRRVCDRDAALLGGSQVDVIEADTVRADRAKLRRASQKVAIDAGARRD